MSKEAPPEAPRPERGLRGLRGRVAAATPEDSQAGESLRERGCRCRSRGRFNPKLRCHRRRARSWWRFSRVRACLHFSSSSARDSRARLRSGPDSWFSRRSPGLPTPCTTGSAEAPARGSRASHTASIRHVFRCDLSPLLARIHGGDGRVPVMEAGRLESSASRSAPTLPRTVLRLPDSPASFELQPVAKPTPGSVTRKRGFAGSCSSLLRRCPM